MTASENEAHSTDSVEMRTVVIVTVEHCVYEYVVDVPADLVDADYAELYEWMMDKGDWPDGNCRDVTLVEIIDVQPDRATP